jgi:hypothetical protein
MLSLSEPDEPTQLGIIATAGHDRREVSRLLLSSIFWRAKPANLPFDRLAIKYRSEVLVLADLFADLFPSDRHVFQYRDALSWMGSIVRGWPSDFPMDDAKANEELALRWSSSIPLVGEYLRQGYRLKPVEIRMLAWVECMERYLDLAAHNLDSVSLRFEDLAQDPEPVLRKLFHHLAIEAADWEQVRSILARDSQAGTSYARELRKGTSRTLTPNLERDVLSLLATRPRLQRPDVVVPNTLFPSGDRTHVSKESER